MMPHLGSLGLCEQCIKTDLTRMIRKSLLFLRKSTQCIKLYFLILIHRRKGQHTTQCAPLCNRDSETCKTPGLDRKPRRFRVMPTDTIPRGFTMLSKRSMALPPLAHHHCSVLMARLSSLTLTTSSSDGPSTSAMS